MDEEQNNREQPRMAAYHRTAQEIREDFRAQGESITAEDVSLITEGAPPKPPFPFLIFAAAVAKDTLDMLDITGFGIIVTTLLSFVFGLVLFIWCLGKTSGGWWKKAAMRGLWLRFLLTMGLETIPFLKMLPVNTIFIWMTHNREKKIVRLINAGLEKFHSAGFQ